MLNDWFAFLMSKLESILHVIIYNFLLESSCYFSKTEAEFKMGFLFLGLEITYRIYINQYQLLIIMQMQGKNVDVVCTQKDVHYTSHPS